MSGIKLKLNTGVPRDPSLGTPSATPGPTPGGSTAPKFKLITKSTPSTPAPVDDAPKPKKTKAGRATKPSSKLLESRKRATKDDTDSENEGSTIAVQHPAKKLKISFGGPKTPAVAQTPVHIKPKIKGKIPKHPPGDGYDSEASDRELDPAIEEEFVLRMMPGEDCEYLRKAIADKKIGMPVHQGGADVQMKFYQAEGRRASIRVRDKLYAATLVDLPCIIEGMKSWDKRGWWKSADICQMLWVFAPIQREDEAKSIPLPKIIDPKTHQYPHGLTPPMHYARKRRFRKRISRTAIEAVEAEVEKLLKEDREALSTKWELFDAEEESRRQSAFSPESEGQEVYSEDDDAEGEVDDTPGYFGQSHASGDADAEGNEDTDAMQAEMEAFLQADELEADMPLSTVEGATPQMTNGDTPGAVEDDSGDESIEDEDGDDEGDTDGEIDEDERAKQAQIQGTREDIADLDKQIESVQVQLSSNTNAIIKKRLEDNLRRLKAERQLKVSSLGEGEDGEASGDD